MPQFPKFDAKIQDKFITPNVQQRISSGYGVVLSYDVTSNTANVVLAENGTDNPGRVLTNVPCPIVMGTNFVAPEQGRACWVDYKDDNGYYPVINNFFSPNYNAIDYPRATAAVNNTPRFMHAM